MSSNIEKSKSNSNEKRVNLNEGFSCKSIKKTTYEVMQNAKYVSIDDNKVKEFANILIQKFQVNEKEKIDTGNVDENSDDTSNNAISYIEWDECGWHYCDDRVDKGGDGTFTMQYIFVIDTLNWCFWPTKDFEYEQLATSLTNVLRNNKNAFNADCLMSLTVEDLQNWFLPFVLPMPAERLNKIHELGYILHKYFDGLAINFVNKANNSATQLVDLIVQYLPGFRDHGIYKGKQVFFYKRAQILVGDLWAAFGRQTNFSGICSDNKTRNNNNNCHNSCNFPDICELTMFADYRVPQLLREEGLLIYAEDLGNKIDNYIELPSNSMEELEIRSCTIQCVEMLLQEIKANYNEGDKVFQITSVELDWLLWQIGEERCKKMKPHHRTLTVYY
jgi:hypothetical protein